MADFRRLALFVTIGSFSIAALLGVLALLSGGDFGETEGRILLTTLLVGVTSIAVLCYLATAESRFGVVGVVGAVCAIPTLVCGLALIWGDPDFESDALLRAFGVGATLSATLAQVSLLLVLAASAPRYVRRMLGLTLVTVAWVAGHVCALILEFDNGGDVSLRLLGVMAILDVLGTVAVAAFAKFGGGGSKGERFEVPADLVPMLRARAEASGQTPEAVLRSLLQNDADDHRSDPATR
ncbi:hypothetical protein [Nocardioides sp.]|uniref:hypothetical protein n=1 Tax=Nocardioides sp. TaxID=35761 RepID=UPI003568A574